MKKAIFAFALAGMALVSCGPSAEEKAKMEKEMQDSIAAVEAAAAEAEAAAAQAAQDSIATTAEAAADSAAKVGAPADAKATH